MINKTNCTIKNETFFDCDNCVRFSFQTNDTKNHDNAYYKIKYIKDGLFRFIGDIISYPDITINNKWIINLTNDYNYNKYEIEYLAKNNGNDINLSISNSFFYINIEKN